MSDPIPPSQESSCQPGPKTVSRRELLRKAGWVVPAVIAIPLMPKDAAATGWHHDKPHLSPTGPVKDWSDWDDKWDKWKDSWSDWSDHKPKWSDHGSKHDKWDDWLDDLFKSWGKKKK